MMTRETSPAVAPLLGALRELAATAERAADQLEQEIGQALRMVQDTVSRGGTLLFCGNGGSAADAQHMATEYVVRYMRNRRAYPAIALTTDTSLITATGNDFGFDHIFERQIEAIGKAGDLLIIHSTSGNSPNVLLAADAARAKGIPVLALSAKDGGALKDRADLCLVVPTSRTDRAQEIHLCIQHAICDAIEATL
jgi:D-sedoheptulose 7-phosphate isomerase